MEAGRASIPGGGSAACEFADPKKAALALEAGLEAVFLKFRVNRPER